MSPLEHFKGNSPTCLGFIIYLQLVKENNNPLNPFVLNLSFNHQSSTFEIETCY